MEDRDTLKYLSLNRYWNKLTSNELVELMKDKTLWEHYQDLRKINNKKLKEQKIKDGKDSRLTYEIINEQLDDFSGLIVDFGCAQNELSKLRKNKVIGLDFYAADENVIECSLTDVPITNNIVDAVIISLSLSTVDYHKILEEAYRILKQQGLLKLVLFVSNVEKLNDVTKVHLPKIGFNIDKKVIIDELIYIDAYKT